MPKQTSTKRVFVFEDKEVGEILANHLHINNMLPPGRYMSMPIVKATGPKGFEISLELEVVENE